jgi:ribosomal protein S18 acetylase RimI-like enzyme
MMGKSTEMAVPAHPGEWAQAFALLFLDCEPVEREARVAQALRLFERGELDDQGIFVVHGPVGLQGAIACQWGPGNGGILFPPGVLPGEDRHAVEDVLVQQACAWLRGQGVRLAQALLTPEEKDRGAALDRNGACWITRLWYLRHHLQLPTSHLATPVRLRQEPYRSDTSALFHEVLERTWEGSLDFPEVNGVRSAEEFLAGYQERGSASCFETWWLVCEGRCPVGVIILVSCEKTRSLELAYLGVVPESRRCGFGREMLLEVLAEARARDAREVTLSVDVRNRPAWSLYRRLGFEPYECREVYLAIWGDSGPSSASR